MSATPEETQQGLDEQQAIDDNSIPGEEQIDLGADEAPEPVHGRSILTASQVQALGAGFINKHRVKVLRGNSYLQAWDVKATLIRVFGWGGFSTEVLEAKVIQIREYAAGSVGHIHASGDKQGQPKTPQVIAQVTMRLTLHNIGPTGQDVVHTEVAIGANSQWDIGEAADAAIKTAESDALKRCAVFLGTQFGLSLYNNGGFADVVRRVFVPWQGKVLADLQAGNAARTDSAVQDQLHRATGGK